MKIRNVFLKSLFGIFTITLIFLSSCNVNNWADSVITNESDFPVTFNFNNTSEKKLKPGESTKFETNAYQYLEKYSPEKRVEFKYKATKDEYTGSFETRYSWEIKLNNNIETKVTLSADGWMEPKEIEIVGEDLYIGDDLYTGTVKIYKDKPKFSAKTEKGSAHVIYTFDKTNCYVTIQ